MTKFEKAVHILDMFCKEFCIKREETSDLKFECGRCPFSHSDGKCSVKIFKQKFNPDYKDFGSMAR